MVGSTPKTTVPIIIHILQEKYFIHAQRLALELVFLMKYVPRQNSIIQCKFKTFAFNETRFFIILKIHEIFYKIREFLFLLYNVFKEKMLANEIGDS